MKSTAISNYCRVLLKHWVLLLLLKLATLNAKMIKKYKCKLLTIRVANDYTVDCFRHYEITNLKDSAII